MPIDRFFLEKPFDTGQEIVLDGEEAHHLIHVVRGKVHEKIELINGKNQLAKASILEMAKKHVLLSLENVITNTPSSKQVILAQGIPRLPRLDTILEKGTELGMTEIWLFPGVKSEKSDFSEQQHLRMKRILIGAMKQCGRLDLPKLVIKPPLKKWTPSDFPLPAFVGDTEKHAISFQSVWQKESSCLFFVGPESGFSKDEIELLHKYDVKSVSLHANILRTDTAAILAMGLITAN